MLQSTCLGMTDHARRIVVDAFAAIADRRRERAARRRDELSRTLAGRAPLAPVA